MKKITNIMISRNSLMAGHIQKTFMLLLFVLISNFIFSQDSEIFIWSRAERKNPPSSKLYIYQAKKPTGVSVLIMPGGSYNHLYAINKEGKDVAKWFNQHGITAFVLRYRVGLFGHHHPDMIEDAQKSILYIRQNADKLNIDKEKIGVVGFSAGGHLGLTAAVKAKNNYIAKYVDVQESLKPNFVVAIYPVVSMLDSIAHKRSRRNLLNRKPTEEQKRELSMELHIDESMPPVFLVVSKDDKLVNYKNSLYLAQALEKNHIPHRFLMYNLGGHGYGLALKSSKEIRNWSNLLLDWLSELSFLVAK